MRTVTTDLGVAACLVENNKILLVKEAKGPQKYHWGLPKGTVDEGELPQIAVIRELKEECGVDGIVQGLVGMRECMIKQTPAIFLAYYVSTENSIVRIDNDEIDDFGWFEQDLGDSIAPRIPPGPSENYRYGHLESNALIGIEFGEFRQKLKNREQGDEIRRAPLEQR